MSVLLEFLGIHDSKTYKKWMLENHPDKRRNDKQNIRIDLVKLEYEKYFKTQQTFNQPPSPPDQSSKNFDEMTKCYKKMTEYFTRRAEEFDKAQEDFSEFMRRRREESEKEREEIRKREAEIRFTIDSTSDLDLKTLTILRSYSIYKDDQILETFKEGNFTWRNDIFQIKAVDLKYMCHPLNIYISQEYLRVESSRIHLEFDKESNFLRWNCPKDGFIDVTVIKKKEWIL